MNDAQTAGKLRNGKKPGFFVLLFACLGVCAGQTNTGSAAPDAAKIMAGVYQQDTSKDLTVRATLNAIDKNGNENKKKFVLRRVGRPGDSKTLIRFTDPKEIRGVELLSVNRKGITDRQWLYTPAIDRVRSIAPRDRSEPFAGSDFTFEDVGERVMDDFTYRSLSSGELIEGHKTYKIEATPVTPDRSQYKLIYFWVAQDIPCILHAELYDQEGRIVRVFHGSQLKHANGMWGTRKVEMSSPLLKTKSVLTIDGIQANTGLDDKLFTPEMLGKEKQK
jgi:outer membrane lipoprotein-sorting protein